MTDVPLKPGKPRVFNVPKLALSATFANLLVVGQAADSDSRFSGWLYVHVTDAQGSELPPENQPPDDAFHLFEITQVSGHDVLVPVDTMFIVETTERKFGALRETLRHFRVEHTPAPCMLDAGQVRNIPFLLVVAPAGFQIEALADCAGTALVSYAIAQPGRPMQTMGSSR